MRINEITKDDLIVLQKDLKKDQEIAKQLKCTRQYVHHLRNNLGIPSPRKKLKSRNQKILELHKSRISGISIAKKFNLSINHVYKIIKQMNKNGG